MPFYESAEEASNSAIIRSEKTFKQVAAHLRPEANIDSAYAWLKNALKDGPTEKLSSDQHMLIANYCGEYDWLYYSCMGCSHSRPDLVSPDDEKANLQREFNKSVGDLKTMLNRIQAIGSNS